MERSRQEHMEWCKKRALAYVDMGDLTQAWASMALDLKKHPETEKHSGVTLGMLLLMSGQLNSKEAMHKFIEGFN